MAKVTCTEDALNKTAQINSLLLNLFERGAEGVDADNDLIGLALNLSCDVVNFLKEESAKNEHR